jgi:4-amino-4-deoxy-L-arabinose transferase-like glycosyltransferase
LTTTDYQPLAPNKLNGWLGRWFPILAILGVAVNATGLFNQIMEPDGALYAVIAKRMAFNNDFINLYGDGGDWLDKPHFPFWITAISFKIFGINAFAYKLPALLFWCIGAFYTYRFAKLVYGRQTAQLATLLYIFALHLILSNFDVRAEPYLTGFIVGCIYHFYRIGQKTSWRHLLAGSLLCACAVMTKGIFVLITIGSGFVVQWVILRQWQQFARWVWYAAILLTLLLITPELYALYQQFDRHPEKWVFGRQHVSGIRFFFWDSQFGRFFNTGPIRGSGDPFFYLHTLLWAFLPWALLLYAALYRFIRQTIRNRYFLPEYISLGTGLVTLLLFSLSKFQLPHYINIVFPFYAILVGHWLGNLHNALQLKWVILVQQIIALVVVAGILGLAVVYRPTYWWLVLILIAALAAAEGYFFRHRGLPTVLGRCCLAMAALGLFVNLFFFPHLLQYQAGMQAGRWLQRHPYPQAPAMIGPASYSLEFYSPMDALRYSSAQLADSLAQQDSVLVFAPLDSLTAWQEHWSVRELQRFPYYPVSRLDIKFLNANTRSKTLQERVLAIISKPTP